MRSRPPDPHARDVAAAVRGARSTRPMRQGGTCRARAAGRARERLTLRRREEQLEASTLALEGWADLARDRDEGIIRDALVAAFDFTLEELQRIANACLRQVSRGDVAIIEPTTFGSMVARWKAGARNMLTPQWLTARLGGHSPTEKVEAGS